MSAWPQAFEIHQSGDFTASTVLHVTCDGSGGKGGGWAWHEQISGAFATGGSSSKSCSNSTFGEAHAIRRAVEDLSSQARVLHIYSDCQSVVATFTAMLAGSKPSTSGAWVLELERAAQVALDAGVRVRIHWVKGHRSHVGNRVTDRLANLARRRALTATPLDGGEVSAMVRQIRRDLKVA